MKRKTTEKVLAIAFVAVMATVVFAVGSVTAQVRSFQISSKLFQQLFDFLFPLSLHPQI